MAKTRRILVAPLDWGLGHATRCIPVIQTLVDCGQEVLIASSGGALQLLKEEFPGLTALEIEGYPVRYPVNGSMAFSMIRQAPPILRSIGREHRQLNAILAQYKPDAVISDNRYGFWSPSIPSVFITHQLHIQVPLHLRWAGLLVNSINRRFILRFDECWVPDDQTPPGLAGDLSHPELKNVKTFYTGPLSRFSAVAGSAPDPAYDLTIILSGPEPQRTLFEEELFVQLRDYKKQALVVRGLPGNKTESFLRPNIKVVSHLSSAGLLDAIRSSGMLISRPGYSSIMDYAALGKNAILVPTPGQTEQDYLARRFKNQNVFYSADQKEFILADALQASLGYSIKNLNPPNRSDLKSHIEKWLQRFSLS